MAMGGAMGSSFFAVRGGVVDRPEAFPVLGGGGAGDSFCIAGEVASSGDVSPAMERCAWSEDAKVASGAGSSSTKFAGNSFDPNTKADTNTRTAAAVVA